MSRLQSKIPIYFLIVVLVACARKKPTGEQVAVTEGIEKTYGKNGNLYSEISMKNAKNFMIS